MLWTYRLAAHNPSPDRGTLSTVPSNSLRCFKCAVRRVVVRHTQSDSIVWAGVKPSAYRCDARDPPGGCTPL